MIVFDKVSLKYHYDDYALLKDVSFTLQNGVNTILCDIQSGKSSICKLLTKQVKQTEGNIFCDGEDISCITNERLGILYLSNNPTFFENRSVLYNIEYPLAVRKRAKAERRAIALEIVRRLGISYVDVKPVKLSASERKLVSLARGLTVPRRIVLFDDFFEDGDNVYDIINLFNADVNVILTSDAELTCGNTVVLDGGYTKFQGDSVKAKQFITELNWLYEQLRREDGK